MRFPWHKYIEIPTGRRNTLQIFITNFCNLNCSGCFARKIMGDKNQHISIDEYTCVINKFLEKGGRQINLLGGEPLLHPNLLDIFEVNRKNKIKTTVYSNGNFVSNFNTDDFYDIKLRISVNSFDREKPVLKLLKSDIPFDVCFMVSKKTTVDELLKTISYLEDNFNLDSFFISSIRELDNFHKEFFHDTGLTMNLLKYKEIIHDFLYKYNGNKKIHISKRGVFESTQSVAENTCRFANHFIGGKIIQCPYDIINCNIQNDYSFQTRYCQHNNTCLMSKITVVKTNERIY